MNESDTRIHKIDPQLKAAGWSVVEGSHISTEYRITRGKISQSVKMKGKKADYLLLYRGQRMAVVEAKADEVGYQEGVMQAIEYAEMLDIRYTYATDGDRIWQIDRTTGAQGFVDAFPSPEELWQMTYGEAHEWRDKLRTQPLYTDGSRKPRYYQENAINRVLDAIAKGERRVLLTLATGTGKTFIAFQIAYKLFQSRWNVAGTGTRPRILFLADRNTLATQAFNSFDGFASDALVRIKPGSIRKEGRVPTNGSIFFTIFQTFMSGENDEPYFGQYPKDFFDLIIIDECHRGGAKDESNWRAILNYFESAVQLGLTATPRVDQNANTYGYFTHHAYEYSLKQGIDDGFLTPFRHINMKSTIDDYHYTPDDTVVSGEVDMFKTYTEKDFYQGNIKIRQRDEARVQEFMSLIDPTEKTLVFCATQHHAAEVRDMINSLHGGNPKYCVRVTANDGDEGERYLDEFKDNEKTIPTILTTSEKLSTGVDALNVRNIVLMRPVNSIIEYKQIVGRGTRVYEGKYYFTIFDFVRAYENYAKPDWDGDPVCPKCKNNPCTCTKKSRPYPTFEEEDGSSRKVEEEFGGYEPTPKKEPLEIILSDKKKRNIKFANEVMFYGKDGRPISAQQFISEMFGDMPEYFQSVEDLRTLWANPESREALLEKLEQAGYGVEVLKDIRHAIDADTSDLLDVLEYISFATTPMERAERAERLKAYAEYLPQAQKAFIEYLSTAYVNSGVEELGTKRLPQLLALKFGSVPQGIQSMGGPLKARETYYEAQRVLYS